MASAHDRKKEKGDWRKEKELEEARKAGTAPAERDEDGNEINPHIPDYIKKAPWYLGSDKPSLTHQRAFNKKTDFDRDWYQRGAQAPAATKYRKGACTNCGSMTHNVKECCERPRKVGAKYTNKDIKPDEVVQELVLDYDGKRDPYNGYDPSSYKEVVDLYEKADAARKKKKLQEIMKAQNIKEGEVNEEELLKEEDDKTFDNEDVAPIQKMDPKSRTTIRNLRIREDTAKYLYNLDLESAFYEPKSRSMRENPLPHANITDIPFAGDNFTRASGETKAFQHMQMFTWEAHEKGQDVDLSAAPSQAAALHQEFLQKKEALKNKSKDIILNKYGGEESLKKPEMAEEVSVPQSEVYHEYSASGKLIKGEETLVKSKYEEDVLINNHKAVWGSYWENGVWGYQCCRQTIKMTYCTGEAGRRLKESKLLEPQVPTSHNNNNNNNEEPESLMDKQNKMTKEERKALDKERRKKEKREEKEKKERLKKAMKEQEEHAKSSVETDERKRGFNSLSQDNYNVSEEDMEAYNLKRMRSDDPMANFKDDDKDQ
eukprot:gene12639-14847_t